MKRTSLLGILLAVLLAPASTWAASVTTNEVGMDAIFSQASFGANTIDIRFTATVTVAGPLNIATAADFTALYALGPPVASPTVNMYFVDSITGPCPVNGAWDGCALLSGNSMVIKSTVAAGGNGAELNAHELGHNLGLVHSDPAVDLMQCCAYGSTTLTAAQVASILASPLVQTDVGGKFISITPYLVTPVPIPAAVWLFGGALGMLGGLKRKASA